VTAAPALLCAGLLLGASAAWACRLPSDSQAQPFPVFRIDPARSAIHFDADAGWHRFTGTAERFDGLIRVDDAARPSRGEACLEIESAGITTGIELRDDTMRRNHLQAERYPSILLEVTAVERIEALGDGKFRGSLAGSLTLRGVSRPLSTPATVRLSPTDMAVEGSVPLRLSAFDIPAPSFLFVTMKDELLVRFTLTATRPPR